jgi:MFS family permease
MFVVGSLNFVLSMFYRSSVAVISPALINDLGFTGAQLSDLSAVFFYAFAFFQLPLGVLLDRVGPRISMSLLAVAAVAGALVFATGQTPNHLILGRILLGIGMAGNLMVVLTLLAAWFPVNQFAFLSGIVVSVGTGGSLLAATPLTLLSMAVGWRGSFLILAAINAVVVLTFILVMKDRPDGAPLHSVSSSSKLGGLGRLFSMYSYWAISLTSFVRYGYFAALQSLWATPFLIYGLGLGEIDASNAILFMGVGYMLGLPLSGSLSDTVLKSRKSVALGGMAALCALVATIMWWTPATRLWMIFSTFFAIGFASAPGQILYAHMKELLPSTMIAQAMTAVNLFTTLGAGVMTHVLSVAIGCDPCTLTGTDGFQPLWHVGGAALLLVTLMYSVVPDSSALKPQKS